MNTDAARMQRWVIRGAPALLLAAPAGHAGGGIVALLVWLALGVLLLPAPPPLYPRRRALQPARLFFAFSSGALAISCIFGGAQWLYALCFPASVLRRSLLLAGTLLLSSCVCGRVLRARLSRLLAWFLGCVLLFGALFLAYRL